jgi:[acyl-carrier-protein] S-malonyltransferase
VRLRRRRGLGRRGDGTGGGETFRMKRAFVFPGQGSQVVGMGRALAAAFRPARRLFEEVDDALSQNLSQLMFEGPEDDLTLTENAQPALMAASLAVIEVLEVEGGCVLTRDAAYVAGHSLGEYSALAAARALTVGDGARLLKLRGRAMQQAVPVGKGAMAALLGLDVEEARVIAAEASCDPAAGEVCAVANDNAPGQVVVSGHRRAVERAIAIARAHGARRSITLPVSAPFHSPLMAPAAETMEDALDRVVLQAPVVPLVANVSATSTIDPGGIRLGLVEQVTAMVRWRESMLFLKAAGVEEVIEIGAGRVLAGLVKRIDPSFVARSVGTPAEVEGLMNAL